jgi:hypothetical protein
MLDDVEMLLLGSREGDAGPLYTCVVRKESGGVLKTKVLHVASNSILA